MFKNALVRKPCKNLIGGLTTANLGLPDYQRALEQHAQYIAAIKSCGLNVTVLNADESFPDSTFIEDTALLTPDCAIITRPGATSRQGETTAVQHSLAQFYDHIETITAPGTIEAGDIMMVDNHFYIGLSQRTHNAGALQMSAILQRYGYSASTVELQHVLHLKTGVSYLENGKLLACGEFVQHPAFEKFTILQVPAEESYAANSLWINGAVLVPAGFPKTKLMLEAAGYKTIAVNVSEFQKLDGGLSCLSLRF